MQVTSYALSPVRQTLNRILGTAFYVPMLFFIERPKYMTPVKVIYSEKVLYCQEELSP